MSSINDTRQNSKVRFFLPATIEKKDRRPTLISYAAALRARGKDFDEIHSELLRVNKERCDPPLRTTRELNDLRRIAKWAASKPAGVLKTGVEEVDFRERLGEAEYVIASYQWRGTFARTCQLVASCVLETMKRTHKLSVDLDTRTVAEKTGYSPATVARALRALSGRYRLRKSKIPVLLNWKRSELRAHAANYTLSRKLRKMTHTVLSHTPSVSVCVKLRSSVHDTFRGKKGLSKSCLLVLEVMEQIECRTAKELAEAGNFSPRTVEGCLTQLKSSGLIEKAAGVWRRTDENLDAIARKRGTAGYAARQRVEHARERDAWREWLSDPQRGRKLIAVSLRHLENAPPPVWTGENVSATDV